jgi:hypothetical protein
VYREEKPTANALKKKLLVRIFLVPERVKGARLTLLWVEMADSTDWNGVFHEYALKGNMDIGDTSIALSHHQSAVFVTERCDRAIAEELRFDFFRAAYKWASPEFLVGRRRSVTCNKL